VKTPPEIHRRADLGLLLLVGVLGATPVHAGATDSPRCHIDYSREKKFGHVVRRATFIVRPPGPRGAVGVWRDDSGDRLGVRVDAGEGTASRTRYGDRWYDYELVRCETVG
jgi:hypothetical protein